MWEDYKNFYNAQQKEIQAKNVFKFHKEYKTEEIHLFKFSKFMCVLFNFE